MLGNVLFIVDDPVSVDVDVSLSVVKVVRIDVHDVTWVVDPIFLIFVGQHWAEGMGGRKTWR